MTDPTTESDSARSGRVRVRDDVISNTAIVVLSWNQCEATLRCLASLAAAGCAMDRVVVWDNGSCDDLDRRIGIEFPSTIYKRYAVNLGVASGRNAAASLAMRLLSPSHLLFLDNDMVVAPGFLRALSSPFGASKRIAQTLAKIRVLGDPQRIQSAGGLQVDFLLGNKSAVGYGEIDRGQYDYVRSCLPSGGAMMVTTTVFRMVDGFDPAFDPYGPEDLDFSCRVRRLGYDALFVPDAVAYHDYSFDIDIGAIGPAYFSKRARHWLILMTRHATVFQQLGFLFVGAPLRAARLAWREIRRGNLAALLGLPSGVRNFFASRQEKSKPISAPAQRRSET